jgi:photosystem II stability/assembly factor-like uncharacterized protein
MRNLLTCCLLLALSVAHAQTPAAKRISSLQSALNAPSPLDDVNFRNIGPTVMSGRVTDVEVNPADPTEFYVAYASGGVWHTVNNGQSFTPIFDREASMTIGDMAMDWKTGTLWVGTGEVNSSRSSYAGTGIYISRDTGKTWAHRGLEESHHIGRIVLHPNKAGTAWVAVLGHLYTANPERGVFMTTDAGQSWTRTLFVNDTTGAVDLILHAENPDILYTATWTRTRRAWHFNGSGEGSGIYRSTDGGLHWNLLSTAESGFPSGAGTGRIGLAQCMSQPGVLYALLDNQNHQEENRDEPKDRLRARDLARMNKETFLNLDSSRLTRYLRTEGYPKKYTAKGLQDSVRKGRFTVKDIADWKLADADAGLFDTPVKGAELYVSKDGGLHWSRTHEKPLEGVYFTYGYYFGTVAVSPKDPEQVYIAGYPILGSTDGGQSFRDIGGENCHPDYHRIWINPKNDRHIIACNDGGLNISYDGGAMWFKANNPAVGQFYAIETDDAKPYNVYGGLQDNGTWVGPSDYTASTGWHQSGQYPYKGIGDGDGMQVQADTRDNQTVYLGYQFGNYFRLRRAGDDYMPIKPVHDIGEIPYRFNWQTPIWLSRHNRDIFYYGSNRFHRSMQQGMNLQTLSEDLTRNTEKGNVPFGTLSSIHESPLRFGMLYAGSDDGQIHRSSDAGYTWTPVHQGLPQGKWVSRVIASRHKTERVYVTLNGYRQDDFAPYLFVSEDQGKTWTDLSGSLPAEPLNVVREDPKDADILYVGSDQGLYVSHNRGKNFTPWRAGLPRVAVHDIAIQDRENDILLGTHGRSIYVADLDLVQQYRQVRDSQLVLNAIPPQRWNEQWGKLFTAYTEPQRSSFNLPVYSATSDTLTFRVLNEKGKVMLEESVNARAGWTIWTYDFHSTAPTGKKADDGRYYLSPGRYTVEVERADGVSRETGLVLRGKEEAENQ